MHDEFNLLQKLQEAWELMESPRTMTLWHGGRLDDSYEASISHKKGRWEHGPGLYLTTHYDTAKKYAKSQRKLYQITVEEGAELDKSNIPEENVHEFIDTYIIGRKKNIIRSSVERITKDGTVKASRLLNLIINEDAIRSSNTNELRNFFVANGIDYALVPNAFGWGEMMLVLYNMDKIVEKKVIRPSDDIEVYDLPTDFK